MKLGSAKNREKGFCFTKQGIGIHITSQTKEPVAYRTLIQ